MKKILLALLLFIAFNANSQVIDYPVSSAATTVLSGENTQISTSGSQQGYQYSLRNDATNTLIGAPIVGTGNSLTFNTENIYTSRAYNIYASNSSHLNFTTSADYIDCSSYQRGIDTSVSVAAWVKTSEPANAIRNIVQKYDGNSDAGFVLRLRTDGKAYFEGRDSTSNYKTSGASSTTINDGQWHYLIGTANLNTGVWKIYVDGILENTTTAGVGSTLANSAVLFIGQTYSSSGTYIGEIRDVTVWNTELSASDIGLYTAVCITGSEAGVVAHYPLSVGLGSIVSDRSPMNIDGWLYIGADGWVDSNGGCRYAQQLTQTATVNVAAIQDLPVTSAQSVVQSGDSTYIMTTGSHPDYNYYLRDNSNNTVVEGPIVGNGNSLSFSTGAIVNTTTYNVFATNSYHMNFIANDDYIDFSADTRNIDTLVSVAAWVRNTDVSYIRNIVLKYGASDAGFTLRLRTDGKAYFEGRDGTGNFKSSGASTTLISDGQWHYLVGTANLSTGAWKIYVDGGLESSVVNSVGNSLINNDPLFIGHTFGSSSEAFVGDVKDVTLWNVELTGSEVSTNMSTCLTGIEANVVGHFMLNRGHGGTVLDRSLVSMDGTASTLQSPWVNQSHSCRDSLEMSQTATVTVGSVGVDEAINGFFLEIYPNPSTGILSIESAKQIETIEILNMAGRSVAIFESTNTIDISSLPNGVYIAKIITLDNKTLIEKLIKR